VLLKPPYHHHKCIFFKISNILRRDSKSGNKITPTQLLTGEQRHYATYSRLMMKEDLVAKEDLMVETNSTTTKHSTALAPAVHSNTCIHMFHSSTIPKEATDTTPPGKEESHSSLRILISHPSSP
jgi:hypothetical protein